MKEVIITGSTGMVGKGVLYECLEDTRIAKVLVINRKSVGIQHNKLEEVLLQDFTQVEHIQNHLLGYDACFYCMGVSALGKNEEQYNRITFDTTKAFADTLYSLNPNMVFNYVSGTGTDSSEQGKSMWARIKGKTENMVLNKGFSDTYMFRPGAILPEKGIQSRTTWYNILYKIMRPFFGLMKRSKNITTTTKIGRAMINTLFNKQILKYLENKDINILADK